MLTKLRNDRGMVMSVILIIVSLVALLLLLNLPEDRIRVGQLWLLTIVMTLSLLIAGNTVISRILNLFMKWKAYPIGRFVVQLLISALFSVIAISFSFIQIKKNFTDSPADMGQIMMINLIGLSILLPVLSIFFGVRFVRSWRKSELEAEQLQKENARSQMQTLKNHLDPHFLFNNLNVLSSLIDHDVKASKVFLDHFAEVYRNFLRSESEDLVTVEEEMQLISSYTHLLKIRFQDGLLIENSIRQEDLEKFVPPLSIQMLLENVVKHNVATRSKPSMVNMSSDGQYIEITNNVQPKPYDEKTVSGTGLRNLKSRFEHYTETPVVIESDESTHKVKIPLLEIESM